MALVSLVALVALWGASFMLTRIAALPNLAVGLRMATAMLSLVMRARLIDSDTQH